MSKFKKLMLVMALFVGICAAPFAASTVYAADGVTTESGEKVNTDASKKSDENKGGFYQIVFGSGIVGMLLWFTLFGDGILAIYFCIDCSILIKPEKLMPSRLIDQIQKAMSEGDIVAAMEACQNTPSAMSNSAP